MKKRVVIFIAVIIIAITGVLFMNKSFIEDSQDYLKGILEASKPQNISIFMLPAVPILTILSPENITYSASTILLNYSAKNAETVWYNLDSIENITITSPLYFSATEGSHILYLYANNSLGESVKSVTFSIQIETTPPSGEGGGSGGGTGGAEQLKENITSPEPFANITEQEMPKNITKKPEEKPASTREITIKFLIILLFLVLLIILVILLIVRIKRKLKKKLSLKKRLWREKEKKRK